MRLKSQCTNDPPTTVPSPTTSTPDGNGHSCLIDDRSHDDKTFIFNRAGKICFCDVSKRQIRVLTMQFFYLAHNLEWQCSL